MSPKLTRLLLAASVAVGFGLAPMLPAEANTSGIDVTGTQFAPGALDVLKGDTVRWYIKDGTHTISPDPERTGAKWPKAASGDLQANDTFEVTFDKGGKYYYRCEKHENMTGEINVKDQDPATTTTTAAPTTTTTAAPTTTTTTARPAPGVTTTTAAPASSAGTKPPVTAAPAPTTTTAKDKKGKDDKKDETTTTTVPPPPPVDLPDSAIIPVLPGLTGTTTQNGIEAPGETPEGDAIALLKKKGGGGKAVKLLILSGVGLGALGIGTAGYKYANRSSKYFPA